MTSIGIATTTRPRPHGHTPRLAPTEDWPGRVAGTAERRASAIHPPDTTCWTLIRGAAAGNPADRAQFADLYVSVVRTYLAARWKSSPRIQHLDDAVQEVFLACFRPDGALARVDPDRPGGFRPYLHGVVRNVARRIEEGRAGGLLPGAADFDPDTVLADEPTLSRVFDRAWAAALVREAGRRQAEHAAARGEAAVRRVELLHLRFHDGLPIREIARRWDADPAHLHHEYATARKEFLVALREVVAFHQPGSPEAVEAACADLVSLLS
jgi:DNA-directed RNA polymerase specialized sigma24 family protein